MSNNVTDIVRIGEVVAKLKYSFEDRDTKVEIEGGTLCWISGQERDAFMKELNELINKYRI